MKRARDAYQHREIIYLPYSVGYSSEQTPLQERRCNWCQKRIESNRFRIGMSVANAEKPKWFHPECFWTAMECGSNTISVDLVDGIDNIMPDDQDTFITNLNHYNSLNHPDQHITGRTLFHYEDTDDPEPKEDVTDCDSILLIMPRIRFFKTENGLNCAECSDIIPPNVIAIMRVHNFVHLKCALRPAAAIIGSLEMSQGFAELSPEDQTSLKLNFVRKQLLLESSPKAPPHKLREITGSKRTILVLSTVRVYEWKPDKYSSHCYKCMKPFAEKDPIVLHGGFYHLSCLFRHVDLIFELPETILNWSTLTDDARDHIRIVYDWAIRAKTEPTTAMTFPRPKKEMIRKRRHSLDDIGNLLDSGLLPTIGFSGETSKQKLRYQLEKSQMLREMFDTLSTEVINYALKYNKREVPENREESLDQLVDVSMFGPPLPCPNCSGQVRFHPKLREYICRTPQEFSLCNFSSKNPPRSVFITPSVYSNYEGFSSQEINTFEKRFYADEGDEECRQKFFVKPIVFEMKEFNIGKQLGLEDFENNRFIIKNEVAVREDCSSKNHVCLSGYHVLKDDETVYYALFTFVEVQHNKNMCVEMYIWERYDDQDYYVMRNLSRIGTSIRMNTQNRFPTKNGAISFFMDQFYEATHNHWRSREKFLKVPNRYFYVNNCISIDHDPGKNVRNKDEDEVIKDLMGVSVAPSGIMLFAKRFAFGKLARRDLIQAYDVLNRLQYLRDKKIVKEWDFINATNTFFTIFPTCCGFRPHKLLNNMENISKAYKLLKLVKTESPYEIRDLYSEHREQARIMLPALDRNSEEWKLITDYHNLNRGATHDVRSEVMEIYRANPGSPSVFDANTLRTLLWHGSPTRNMPPILKNGLQLPTLKTSRMFGSGIYFSDCFTKSVFYSTRHNYPFNGHVYALLCEVKMDKIHKSIVPMNEEEVEKALREGFDSVFGTGRKTPDKMSHVSHDNVLYPIGELVDTNIVNSSLEYNEFIIYDEKQVEVKFVVKLKMGHAMYI